MQQTNVRQLTVLGFPEPGHRYWTEETLRGVAARYPLLDMEPWRKVRPAPDPTRERSAGRWRRRRRVVVGLRGPLSDLSPLVRRLERRRRRGCSGDHRAPGPSGVVGHRWRLAFTRHALTQCGLGLRRLRLHGRGARVRDTRRRRSSHRRGRTARHPRPDGPGAQPHQRSASMVRGLPLLPHGRQARLVRVGRSQAGRFAAEQLGEQFRRAGLDRRRRHGAVVPAQPPGRTAGSELVERGGACRLRRDHALLVRPGRCGLPDRCVQRHHQGRVAA